MDAISPPLPPTLSGRTQAVVRQVISGRTVGLRGALALTGPAVVASVAYIDPGNIATNVQAGSAYGYALLWVVLAANLVAMLFQALSARIGIVTGQNLAELCRAEWPGSMTIAMWAVCEIGAMATDLAEFLGGSIGLTLLLHVPLLAGMGVTALVTYGLLLADRGGFRPLELIIGALVGTVCVCYLLQLFLIPADWGAATAGMILPRLPDEGAVTLAVGIFGATVMPHAIFLHSGLTQSRVHPRNDAERRLLLRYSNREVIAALSVAGAVNIAMVMTASAAFHAGHRDVAQIETAYHTLTPLLGGAAAALFLTALMASGISSSVVGTMAGQLIMQGFLHRHVPIWLRRVVTMAPAFLVVALGADATHCLVLSQVVLSLVLPVPMIALLLLSRRPHIMGAFAISGRLLALAALATAVTLTLDAVLLVQTLL